MIRCPYCGKQNDDESLFCTECGKPISQDNVCPHCGASVNDDDSFCQSCGKVINESSDIGPIAYEEDEKSDDGGHDPLRVRVRSRGGDRFVWTAG